MAAAPVSLHPIRALASSVIPPVARVPLVRRQRLQLERMQRKPLALLHTPDEKTALSGRLLDEWA
jgi:hypothetical protein